MADDEFVIGFWDSEWTGIAPMLEEDVATSSIAQDEIGHAKALYELLAELTDDDPDRIAFGREVADYRHAALLNHARGDWAFSVARRYLYETADAVRLTALTAFVARAASPRWPAKMRREETYHMLHADAWVRRLADGDARDRLVAASSRCGPMRRTCSRRSGGRSLVRDGWLPQPMSELHAAWAARVRRALEPIVGELAVISTDAPTVDGVARTTSPGSTGSSPRVSGSEEGALW